MAPRKKRPTPRKAAKPPVINLKAQEVKPAAEKPVEKQQETKKPTAAGANSSTPKVSKAATDTKKPQTTGAAASNTSAKTSTTTSPKPEPKPAPKPKKKTSGKGTLVIAGLVALAAAGLGGAWVYKEYGSRFFAAPQSVSEEKLAAAIARIDILEKQLTETRKAIPAQPDTAPLEKQAADNAKKNATLSAEISKIRTALAKPANTSPNAALAGTKLAVEELSTKVVALEKQLASLPKQAAKPDTAAVDALKEQLQNALAQLKASDEKLAALQQQTVKLAEQQKSLAGTGASKTAIALAHNFTALRSKVNAGVAFGQELDALTALLPQEKALDILRNYAPSGVPTLAALTSALKAAPTSAQSRQKQPATDKSLLGSVSQRLSGLVKITKVDALDWNNVKRQALGALEIGDLEKANTILSGQPDDIPPALAKWRESAAAKLAATRALQAISTTVMAALSAKTN